MSFNFEVIPVIPTDKARGCNDCSHTGLVHMVKGREHRHGYCICPLGISMSRVEMHKKNKHMRTKEFLERKNWRMYKG